MIRSALTSMRFQYQGSHLINTYFKHTQCRAFMSVITPSNAHAEFHPKSFASEDKNKADKVQEKINRVAESKMPEITTPSKDKTTPSEYAPLEFLSEEEIAHLKLESVKIEKFNAALEKALKLGVE